MTHAQPAYFPKVSVARQLREVDGVIEAVHYAPDGRIAWARAYVRRFANFSDRVRLSRQELIRRLQNGQRFYLGRREPLFGAAFDLGSRVRLSEKDGAPFIVLEGKQGTKELEGAPLV